MMDQVELFNPYRFGAARHFIVPALGFFGSGLVVVLVRSTWVRHRVLGMPEKSSLMDFSALGTLQCICGSVQANSLKPDRRQFCRNCGCEVVARDTSLLIKQLSAQEIRSITRTLRQAATRASELEIPPNITTIAELQEYLKSEEKKKPRNSSPPPTALKHPQAR
jgi:hypothetical protein